MWAGAEPEGYNLSHLISLKSFFVSTCFLSGKIINIYNDIARKYGNVAIKNFPK